MKESSRKLFLYSLDRYGPVASNLLFETDVQREMADWILGHSATFRAHQFSMAEEERLELKVSALLIERLEDLSSKFSGFSELEWSFIEKVLSSVKATTIPKKLCQWLQRRALEANRWRFVLDLGKADMISFIQAEIYLKKYTDSEHPHLLGEILNLRIRGDQELAIEKIEKASALKIVWGDDWEQGQAHLICGSPFFNKAHYSKAVAIYRQAFELFDLSGEIGSGAIAAFNLAVTYHALGLDQETDFWLKIVQQKLTLYQLPCLKKSLLLFESQRLLSVGKAQEAVKISEELFAFSDLSDIQKVIGSQNQAQAYLELGHIFQAQIALGQSRRWIAEKGLSQFSSQQAALETRESSFGIRECEHSHSLNFVQDPRADAQLSLALLGAKLRRMALQARPLNLLSSEFENYVRQTPIVLQKRLGIGPWLEAVSEPYRPSNSIQVLEVQLFSAIAQKNWPAVHAMIKSLQAQVVTPWTAALKNLSLGFYSFALGEREQVLRYFNTALEQAQSQGLLLIACLARGGLVYQDPHHEVEWLHTLGRCSPSVKEDVAQFFLLCFGEDITSPTWLFKKSEMKSAGIVVNEREGTVIKNGKPLDIKSQSLLFLILKKMIESGANGVSKEQIVEAVWNRDYDPLRDDPVIYSHIRRLRKTLHIELHMGRYRVSASENPKVISRWSKESPLTPRQRKILSLLSAEGCKMIKRQEVMNRLKLSARTVVRELSLLVEKRLLLPVGAGRSAGYIMNKGA